MKKLTKRALAGLLVVLMVVLMMPVMAFAETKVATLTKEGGTGVDYESIAAVVEAFNSADAGNYTIVIEDGKYEIADVVIKEASNKTLTIKPKNTDKVTLSWRKEGVHLSDKQNVMFAIFGGSSYDTNLVTIEGINFSLTEAPAFHYMTGNSKDNFSTKYYEDNSSSMNPNDARYPTSVTVKNCDFTGTGSTDYVCWGTSGSAASGMKFENCTVKGVKSFLNVYSSSTGVVAETFEDVGYQWVIDNVTSSGAINIQDECNILVRNSTINSTKQYAIRSYGGNIYVKDSTLTCAEDDTGGVIYLHNGAQNELYVTILNSTLKRAAGVKDYDVYAGTKHSATIKAGSSANGVTLQEDVTVKKGAGYNFPKPVAKIGDTKYETFEAAFAAAKSSKEHPATEPTVIELLDDVTIKGTVGSESNKALFMVEEYDNITINGNGHTIVLDNIGNTTGKGAYIFNVRGPAVFNDINFERSNACKMTKFGGVFNVAGQSEASPATLELNDCNIDLIKANTTAGETWGAFPVNTSDYSVVTVNGGKYTGGKADGSDNKGFSIGKDSSKLYFNYGYTNGIHFDGYAATLIVKDGQFIGSQALRIDESKADNVSITGGFFGIDVSKYVELGYECVANKDSVTKGTYPYMVQVISGKPVIDEKTLEESKVEVPKGAEPGVTEKVIEEALKEIVVNEAVTEKNATNIKSKEVEKTLQEIIEDMVKSSSQLQITVQSVETKTEEIEVSAIEATTITTTSAKYDVKPWVSISTTDKDGNVITETRVITNDELKEAVEKDPNFKITFRLAVPESMTNDSVFVSHYPDGKNVSDWTKEYPVLGKGSNRYVELSATEFSVYEVSQITEENAVAKITAGGKTTFYGTLERAVAEVKDGGKIELLKDTDETIVVDKEIEFTIAPKDKVKNSATIKAGKGFELKTAKDKDGSVKYTIAKVNPKTGDSNNIGLFVGLGGVALLAIIVLAVLMLKKKSYR